jgi:UDP-GlcNAc:undecaprenyl-phosphate/decaprenyl-phosphate GlcNAc-1-phosphate transferase
MFHFQNYIFILTVCFLLSVIYLLNNQKIANFLKLIDKPNSRKQHKVSVAITGGLGLMTLTIFSFIFFDVQNFFFISEEKYFEIIIFSFLIFLIGIIDDKYELNPKKKLLFSSLVYFIFLKLNHQFLVKEISFSWTNHTINLGSFSFLFTLLCFVIYLQIANMFDGVNLQCSLYSITLFLIFYSILKNTFFLILVLYLIVFSYWNFKNKSFLGDGGNYLISFFVSLSLVQMYNNYYFNVDHIIYLILFPTIDLIRLFFVRIKSKKSPFMSDRNHIHHYLLNKFNYGSVLSGYVLFLFLLYIFIYFRNLYFFQWIVIIFIMFYFFLLILCNNNLKK